MSGHSKNAHDILYDPLPRKEVKTMAKKKALAYEDLKKLKDTFKEMDNDKSKLALSLLDEAYFCGDTLKKLKEKVEKDGVVTEMSQGNYSIDRENPALKSYNTTIKNYQALIKQITDLLPNQNSNNGDEFDGDNLGDDE